MKKINGHDDALIGVFYDQWDDNPPRLAYDTHKILAKLEEDGMTAEDAFEYFHFNIAGAYVGKDTPVFIDQMSMEEADDLADELDDAPDLAEA